MGDNQSIELRNHLRSTGLPDRIVDREYNESLFFTEIKGHLEAAKAHLLESGLLLENIHLRHDGWDSFLNKCDSYGIDRRSVGLSMVVASDHGGFQLDTEAETSKPRQISGTLSIETGQIDFFMEGKLEEATKTSRELANHNRRLKRENTALDSKLQVEKNKLDVAGQKYADLEDEAEALRKELDGRAEWKPDGVGEMNLHSDIMMLKDKAVLFRNVIRSKLAHIHEDASPRLIAAVVSLLSYIEGCIGTATAEVLARIGQIDAGAVSRSKVDADYLLGELESILEPDEIIPALNVVEDEECRQVPSPDSESAGRRPRLPEDEPVFISDSDTLECTDQSSPDKPEVDFFPNKNVKVINADEQTLIEMIHPNEIDDKVEELSETWDEVIVDDDRESITVSNETDYQDVPLELTDPAMVNNMTAHVNDLPSKGKRKEL